jgi:hypothetical protein
VLILIVFIKVLNFLNFFPNLFNTLMSTRLSKYENNHFQAILPQTYKHVGYTLQKKYLFTFNNLGSKIGDECGRSINITVMLISTIDTFALLLLLY